MRLAALLLALLLPVGALAQDFPTKPVRIVVPFQPGGGSDTLARLLGEKIGPKWGQPIVVENRTGAGGNVGAEFVAKAAPDGYTLFLSSPGPLVINKSLYAKLAFDPEAFVPIGIIATNFSVLAAHPKTGVDSVPALIAYARANPDKLNYASGGSGTTPHLAMELLKSLSGVRITHVPYKGVAPGFTALLGGETDLMFVDTYLALPHVRTGKIRALALGGGARSALLPGVPVMSEIVPGFDYQVWQGMVAPAGTSAAVVTKVSAAIAEAVKQPDVVKRLADMGLETVGSTPGEMAAVMKADRERWGRVIRETGAKAD